MPGIWPSPKATLFYNVFFSFEIDYLHSKYEEEFDGKLTISGALINVSLQVSCMMYCSDAGWWPVWVAAIFIQQNASCNRRIGLPIHTFMQLPFSRPQVTAS